MEDNNASLKRRADRIVLDHLNRHYPGDEALITRFSIDADLADIAIGELLPETETLTEILRRHQPIVPGQLPGFFPEPEPVSSDSGDDANPEEESEADEGPEEQFDAESEASEHGEEDANAPQADDDDDANAP